MIRHEARRAPMTFLWATDSSTVALLDRQLDVELAASPV
jgi:hypothetical protein